MEVKFALPTLSDQDMHWDRQFALTVNQATAIIVSNYLDYAARVITAAPDRNVEGGRDVMAEFGIRKEELLDLIDQVQGTLRKYTD